MRYLRLIGAATALALATSAEALSFEEKAQVTIGGAESLITGHIVKIENDAYWIRQATGDVTRVKVTEGTNLICRTRPGVSEAKVESKPGIGFRIGDCPFTPGDTVKAEVSSLGWASLVRYIDEPPASQTAKLGLPQGWDGEIPQGVLTFKAGPQYPVRTKDGKHVGHLAGTLVDTISGAAYGLLIHASDRHMMPVPWTKLRQEWPEPNKPVVVVLETEARLARMHPPVYPTANLISIQEVRDFWTKASPPGPLAAKEVDVEIVIDKKAYEITKGGTDRGFDLVAGMPTAIRLRNRDVVAHEFLSTMFRDVPFRVSGNATMVKTAKASGIRLDPGQIVTLEFTAPLSPVDEYGAMASLYDVFWCGIHGKEHGEKMRGEILVVETRGEIGGG